MKRKWNETINSDSEGWFYDAHKELLHVVFERPSTATSMHVSYDALAPTSPGVDVNFIVTLPENTPDGPIYVASDAGGWAADGQMLQRTGPREARGTLRVAANETVNFKLTRGSWTTVQKSTSCNELGNSAVTATADFGGNHRVLLSVERWADDGC